MFCQDHDIPLSASFIPAMHDGIKGARGLIVVLTADYETSAYTSKKWILRRRAITSAISL